MPTTTAKKARSKAHNTQWAAQFAVASELCKMGYEVAFTMGNTPRADLMVVSPTRQMFLIDVKGLREPNAWLVRRKEPIKDLYYVLALVQQGVANRFFVLTQEEANNLVAEDTWSGKQVFGTAGEGFSFKAPSAFENLWSKLPR